MGTKILLIDDDTRILETFARTLKLVGYTVIKAEDGERGLRLYHQEQPDIVLLDVRMPGIGGLEVLETMRAHDPEVNVILCTEHTDHNDMIEALRAGATDLLPKPVGQSELESALRRAEERIQLKQKLRARQEALQRQNEQLEARIRARTEALTKTIARLQESEDRYRSLFVNNHATMLLIDPETGAIVDANPAACAYYGYTKEELTARTIVDINALSEAEVFQEMAQAQSESRQHFLFCHRLANGEVRDVEVCSGPIWVQGKQLLYSIIHDIAERKQAEDALQASEKRFKSLYTAMTEGVCLHELVYDDSGNAVDYRIVDVNPSYEKILGLKRQDVVERLASDIYGADEPPYLDLYARVAQTGEPTRFETYFPPMDKHFSISVFSPQTGQFATTFEDITKRRRSENALKESEQRMEMVLWGADLGTWDWNVETGENVHNARWAEMLGYTLEEVEPHIDLWKQLIHPDDLPQTMSVLNAHLKGEMDSYEATYRLRHKSGDWIWVLDRGRVIERDAAGNPLRACGTLRDITESKEAEKMLRNEI